MSKQRTNNNKRPANSRPASSKGRSNSSEGRGPKKSSNTRSTSSRSEDGRSSRSGFDKKASAKRPASSRSGSERGPKEEKDLYGSKRTTQSKAKKFETSKRAVGRGPSGRKPVKKTYTDRDESFIPYDKRSEDTKSPYIKRGVAQSSSSDDRRSEPRRGGEGRPTKRLDSRAGNERSPAKRSYTKRGEGSAEYKSRAGEGRSSAPKKTYGPKGDTDSRSTRGSDAAKFPNKRSASPREESSDFKRKSNSTRRAIDNKDADVKPRGRREVGTDDFDNDDDDSNDGNEKEHKPKFDKDQVKKGRKAYENKLDKLSKSKPNAVKVSAPDSYDIRLNKYISNSGVCSRREADQLILEGTVKVNGVVITELGYKVKPEDSVKYNNKVLNPEKSVYVLLNKPKDFITTMEDENDRKTVMQLVANSTKERIYPVGRLDRNTTGLLLFTNDGELAQKLTHPSNKVKKIYEVELDKPITAEDFDKIVDGKVHLFDGPVKVDEAAIISPSKKIIGIEIHEGRNRIVRRIFESLGYDVLKLDRVMYAGLTKKNIPRGSWRYLTATEVNKIKYLD